MLSYPENLWLGGLGVLLAIVFSTSWALLTSVSPGIARRLEDENETLAKKVNSWLDNFEQLRASLHVLLVGDVVFLDEPTTNLDKQKRGNLVDQIRNLEGFEQLTIVSHNNTFESLTENVISLEKRNGATEVVSQ